MTLRPIELPWLFWRQKDGVFDAKASDLFIKAWHSPVAQPLMIAGGYALVDIDFMNRRARFDPTLTTATYLEAGDAAIRHVLSFDLAEIERKAAKRQAIADRRDSALGRAQQQRDRWGRFCSGYHRIFELEVKMLTDAECDLLDEYAKSTIARAAAMRRRAEVAEGGVDWSDDLVVEALQLMSNLDDDVGEFANRAGWDIVHSAPGHWCVAMLEEDRALAIRLGRTIVGHYDTRQLAAIVERSAA